MLGTDLYRGYCKVQFWKGKRAESQVIYACRLGQGQTTGREGQQNVAKLWAQVSRLHDGSTSVAYKRACAKCAAVMYRKQFRCPDTGSPTRKAQESLRITSSKFHTSEGKKLTSREKGLAPITEPFCSSQDQDPGDPCPTPLARLPARPELLLTICW